MITYFCPACWSVIPEKAAACPQCGADLNEFEHLSIEQKYILALRHPVSENRIMAVRYLGELGSRAALPEFERMLQEENEYYVLREVVFVLTRIRDPQTRRLLKVALNHPSYLISYLAKRYLDPYTEK